MNIAFDIDGVLTDFEQLSAYYRELPFDRKYLESRQDNIKRFIRFPRILVRASKRIELAEDAIPENTKGTIFICNHRHSWDVPMCYHILNRSVARILTKREYEASRFVGLMRYMGIIFLNREDKKSAKIVQNLMMQTVLHGGNVCLFPEGTRNRTEQKLLPFKYGAVYMAQVTGAPIIPVIINRTGIWSYEIRIGNEYFVDYNADLDEANRRLQEEMCDLLTGGIG